ncbi:unnamed protein product [Rangifer tarandus platyrhynchus]|uniref:Uncharacterized protein n=1 Tax=Rangifer tarandus platyrhynchus TaxID=3082113 RepID=A0AC59ZML2_RANTA
MKTFEETFYLVTDHTVQTSDAPSFISTYHRTEQKGLPRHIHSPSCVSGWLTAGTFAAIWAEAHGPENEGT